MSKSKKKLIAATKAALGIAPVDTASTAPLATEAQAAAAPAAPVEKKTRSHRPAGLGFPNAKKLVNPQHTLEAKKEAAKKLGGTMLWANKNWVVKVPAGEFQIPSRKMAALSVATFIETVSQAPQAAPAAPAVDTDKVPLDLEAPADQEATEAA